MKMRLPSHYSSGISKVGLTRHHVQINPLLLKQIFNFN